METIMETKPDGRTYGWLGITCTECKGCGRVHDEGAEFNRNCGGCGGTGEAYGFIPTPGAKCQANSSTENLACLKCGRTVGQGCGDRDRPFVTPYPLPKSEPDPLQAALRAFWISGHPYDSANHFRTILAKHGLSVKEKDNG